MSSNTIKMCNGCGDEIEAIRAAGAGWIDLTIKLLDRSVPEASGVTTTVSEIDICPTCTPAFAGVLAKLEPNVRELLLKKERLPLPLDKRATT